MSTTTVNRTMTTDEFLAIAEVEGVTRELINGELVEYAVTTRNPSHSTAVIRIGKFLDNWLDEHATIVGVVSGGEVRTRLAVDPDIVVGLDVAYFEGAEAVRQSQEQLYFDGPPILAVEVLSPSDTHENVVDKLHRYLDNGVKQVWIVDPDLRTVVVYRPDAAPVLFNATQELTGEPELPGFSVPVQSLFQRTQQS